MRFSWNNIVEAISLGASEAGIRRLRLGVRGYIDQDGSAFTSLVASLCDHELEKIQKGLHRDLRGLLKSTFRV